MFKSVLLNFISILIINWIVPVINYSSWIALLIGSVVLSLLNATLKPLLQLLFLPMNIITLGIFGWIINGVVLGLALFIVPGLSVQPLVLFDVQMGTILSLIIISFFITVVQRLIDLVI